MPAAGITAPAIDEAVEAKKPSSASDSRIVVPSEASKARVLLRDACGTENAVIVAA